MSRAMWIGSNLGSDMFASEIPNSHIGFGQKPWTLAAPRRRN